MNPVELRELMKDAEVRGQYLASIRHRGKDVLLGDIEKLIEIMIDEAVEIEERKTENAILNQQLSAKTIPEQNIINAFGISGEGAHSKLVIEYVHGLVAENSALKGAIEFAEPWLPSCDGELLHIISQAKITPATDAAIAEIKAQGVDEFARTFNSETIEGSSMVMVAKAFAANLHAGRKG